MTISAATVKMVRVLFASDKIILILVGDTTEFHAVFPTVRGLNDEKSPV